MPSTSMHTTRDRSVHDRRRRIWSPAFSDKALRGYENRIQKYNDLLIKQISAFGKSYKMLESGEKHWSLQVFSEGMDPHWFQFSDLVLPRSYRDSWRCSGLPQVRQLLLRAA